MFQGLEHTAIATPDPKRLAEWYVQKLDFRLNYTYGGNYFVRGSNGTLIEFIPSEGDRAPQQMKDPGIRHLAITVDDFDVAMQELRSRGIEFLTQPTAMQGNRLIFFSDADGNYLHLIQRPQPLP
jgi:glyoxylase I family protein